MELVEEVRCTLSLILLPPLIDTLKPWQADFI